MIIMGMSRFYYILSWFLAYIPIYLILSLFTAGILTMLTPKINYGVYFLMYFIFGILLCFQAMFLSTLFSSTKISISVACLFYAAQYLLVLIVK